MKQPRLFKSELSGQWYIVTKYDVVELDNGHAHIVAKEKFRLLPQDRDALVADAREQEAR